MEWSKFIGCIQTDIKATITGTARRRIEKEKLDLSETQLQDVIKHGDEMVDSFMSITEKAGPVVAAHVLGTLVAETYFIYLKAPNNKDFPATWKEDSNSGRKFPPDFDPYYLNDI